MSSACSVGGLLFARLVHLRQVHPLKTASVKSVGEHPPAEGSVNSVKSVGEYPPAEGSVNSAYSVGEHPPAEGSVNSVKSVGEYPPAEGSAFYVNIQMF